MSVAIDTALCNRAEEKRWDEVGKKVAGAYGDPVELCARTAARARGVTTNMPIAPEAWSVGAR